MSNEDEITPERLAKLEERLARAERSLWRLRRRQRTCNALALFAVLFVLFANKTTLAVRYGAVLDALTGRVAVIENKTASINTLTDPNTGQPTVRFSGVNVQVVNGTGNTEQGNGLGNIIIGYNELRSDEENYRKGSHNLVVGRENNYLSVGGIVSGEGNAILGRYSSVTSGTDNTASGFCSSVTGGTGNFAMGSGASVSGGIESKATGEGASVSGGFGNVASGVGTTIAGGYLNTANGNTTSILGGVNNTVLGKYSTIGGGKDEIVNCELYSLLQWNHP